MKELKLIIATFIFIVGCSNQKNSSKTTSACKDSIQEIPTKFVAESPNGIKFAVDDVQKCTDTLNTYPAKAVFEHKIRSKVICIPQAQENMRFIPAKANAFIATVHEAYASHRPLSLSPDEVWLLICQGAALHINKNFKTLEPVILKKDAPKVLNIRNDSLGHGARYWKEFSDSLSCTIGQYVNKDVYDLFTAEFSTTGDIERTAYQIVLMDALSKKFTYVAESGCGIPYITLQGELADWNKLYNRLDALQLIGMQDWAKELRPLIREFIKAYEGQYNLKHWQQIYKTYSEYGTSFISGWILKFFPYLVTTEIPDMTKTNDAQEIYADIVYRNNPYIKGFDFEKAKVTSDMLPTGINKVDIIWTDYLKQEQHNLELISGFLAIKQYEDLSLEPCISWIMREKNSTIVPDDVLECLDWKVISNKWSPSFSNKPITDSASYGNNTSYTESAGVLKGLLNESYSADLKDIDSLRIEVLNNGKVNDVNLYGKNVNDSLQKEISDFIHSLPGEWKCAQGFLYSPEDEIDSTKCNINTFMTIRF